MLRALVFEFASLSLRQHDDVDDFKSVGVNNSDPVIVDLDVLIFAICRYDLDHSQRHRIQMHRARQPHADIHCYTEITDWRDAMAAERRAGSAALLSCDASDRSAMSFCATFRALTCAARRATAVFSARLVPVAIPVSRSISIFHIGITVASGVAV